VGGLTDDAVSSVAHVIQTALTPVFLLSGIGTLLNVFNQRLIRVSDHFAHMTDLLKSATEDDRADLLRHVQRLQQRRLALDASVALLAVAGVATCAAAFALFVGSLRDVAGGTALVWLFGASLGSTVAAIAAFFVDTVLAWHGLHMEGPMPRGPAQGQAGILDGKG
jgi:hypothetical protein